MRGCEVVVKMLCRYGVRHIFGLPGDTSTSLYEALYDAREEITHIMVRDERSAAFMADVYARLLNRPGICEGPSGGGATYTVPGISEANSSCVPVIAINTDVPLEAENQGALTALDQESLFRPVTKWNTVVKRTSKIAETLRTAFRVATSGRPGAVHLSFPRDVLDAESNVSDLVAEGGCATYPAHRVVAHPTEIEKALRLLLRAERPVIIAGGGVLSSMAWSELVGFAEALQVPVATTINGKGAITETHRLSLGVVGGNGGKAYVNDMVREADLVFFIGSRANSTTTADWTVPRRGEASVLQLDIDPVQVGNNFPLVAGLVGDAQATLNAMLEMVPNSPQGNEERDDWARRCAARLREGWDEDRESFLANHVPIRPQRLIAELQGTVPKDTILVVDPGTPTPFVSAYYRVAIPGRWVITPRAHGGLGYAIPGAVAAKVARPEATVVALCGDGSVDMSLSELETITRLDVKVVIVVFNNRCFGWIKALQKLYHGGKYLGVDFDPDTNYREIAKGYGLWVERVVDPGELASTLKQAFEVPGAALVDVVTESEAAELPPVEAWHKVAVRHDLP